MEEYLGVYDADSEYAHALCLGLGRYQSLHFEIVEFTKEDSIPLFALKKHLSVLILPEDEELQEKLKPVVGLIVTMTEEPVKEQTGTIYKYQPLDNVVRQLEGLTTRVGTETRQTRIYGVYSPVGSTLKTTTAALISGILSERGSTLFITFDEYSPVSEIFKSGPGGGTLSDALYAYMQGNLPEMEAELIRSFHGFDYLAPASDPGDIRESAPENIRGLIEYFAENHYRNLVLDIGNALPCAVDVLNICDEIYMPVKGDFLSKAKVDRFDEYIGNSLAEKVHRLHPPYQLLGKDDSLSGYYDRLTRGEMIDYVRSELR